MFRVSPGGLDHEESACNVGDEVQSLGLEDPLEKEMTTHSGVLACRIMWTEEPGGLQSMGSQRVRHTERLTCFYSMFYGRVTVGMHYSITGLGRESAKGSERQRHILERRHRGKPKRKCPDT